MCLISLQSHIKVDFIVFSFDGDLTNDVIIILLRRIFSVCFKHSKWQVNIEVISKNMWNYCYESLNFLFFIELCQNWVKQNQIIFEYEANSWKNIVDSSQRDKHFLGIPRTKAKLVWFIHCHKNAICNKPYYGVHGGSSAIDLRNLFFITSGIMLNVCLNACTQAQYTIRCDAEVMVLDWLQTSNYYHWLTIKLHYVLLVNASLSWNYLAAVC